MDKEIKNKIMIVFTVAAFLMLFAFQGKADDSNTKEPASVDEAATLSIPESTDLSEGVVEEDSIPVYIPSTEDSGEENSSFDE